MIADLPGVEPAPKPARTPKYASQAEKQAAYRARKGLVAVTIQLPAEVAAALDAWLVTKAAKGRTKSVVLAHLIQTQLLRKR